jgi:hypothetical protein
MRVSTCWAHLAAAVSIYGLLANVSPAEAAPWVHAPGVRRQSEVGRAPTQSKIQQSDLVCVDAAGRVLSRSESADEVDRGARIVQRQSVYSNGRTMIAFGTAPTGTSVLQLWVLERKSWRIFAQQSTGPRLQDIGHSTRPTVGVPISFGSAKDLTELEHVDRKLAAAKRDGDAQSFLTHSTPDFLAIGPFITMTRAQVTNEFMRHGTLRFTIHRARAVRVNGDAAFMLTVNSAGTVLVGSVYVKEGDRWLVAAEIETPLVSQV